VDEYVRAVLIHDNEAVVLPLVKEFEPAGENAAGFVLLAVGHEVVGIAVVVKHHLGGLVRLGVFREQLLDDLLRNVEGLVAGLGQHWVEEPGHLAELELLPEAEVVDA
jgi:hypothetical protein